MGCLTPSITNGFFIIKGNLTLTNTVHVSTQVP